MRQWRVGTLSMGIILIVLGIVMLYSQIADLRAMDLILKWWPIILVLLGVEILVYIVLSKQEQPKVKFDVFSIIIITFIMIAGVGAYAVTSVIQYAKGNTSFLSAIDIYRYESCFERNMTVDLGEKDTLKIENSSGSVEVVKGDSDKIEIKANIIIRNNDEQYATEISDDVIEVVETDVVSICSKTNQYTSNNGVVGSIHVNYYIRVPEKINVEVDNKFGDVNVNGILLNARINNSHGEIIASSIGKDLHIDNSFGYIRADDVKGKTEIYQKNGDITARNLGDGLIVENSFGYIEISNIKAYANVKNSNGKVKASYVGGNLQVKNKIGDIELEEISGTVNVVDEYGDIDINNIDMSINVENKFGDIKVFGAGSKIELTGQNGDIVLENDELIKDDVTILNKYGEITLKLLEQQKGYFDVKTEFGSIDSEFEMSVNEEDINKMTAKNTIGNNDINIYLGNKNGDINIKKF